MQSNKIFNHSLQSQTQAIEEKDETAQAGCWQSTNAALGQPVTASHIRSILSKTEMNIIIVGESGGRWPISNSLE